MICRNLSTRHADDERDTILPYTSLFWAGSCNFCTNVCFKAFSKSPSIQIGWIWPVLNGQVPVAKPQISIVFMSSLDSNLGRALGCLWLKDNSGNCKSLLLHLGHCVQEFLRLGAVTSSALCSTEQMSLSIYELVGLLQCDWFSCAFSHWSSFSPPSLWLLHLCLLLKRWYNRCDQDNAFWHTISLWKGKLGSQCGLWSDSYY